MILHLAVHTRLGLVWRLDLAKIYVASLCGCLKCHSCLRMQQQSAIHPAGQGARLGAEHPMHSPRSTGPKQQRPPAGIAALSPAARQSTACAALSPGVMSRTPHLPGVLVAGITTPWGRGPACAHTGSTLHRRSVKSCMTQRCAHGTLLMLLKVLNQKSTCTARGGPISTAPQLPPYRRCGAVSGRAHMHHVTSHSHARSAGSARRTMTAPWVPTRYAYQSSMNITMAMGLQQG